MLEADRSLLISIHAFSVIVHQRYRIKYCFNPLGTDLCTRIHHKDCAKQHNGEHGVEQIIHEGHQLTKRQIATLNQ